MKAKRILILEDEIIIARHIQVTLEKEGYEVARTSNFKDFKLVYKKRPPALAIVDINLKTKLYGIQVGAWIKEHDQIPFIFLSSYTDNATVQMASKTRPSGYLLKPFRVKELIHNISIVISNHRQRSLYEPIMSHSQPISEVPFKLKKVIHFIEANLDSKISLDQLSELAGWSKHHFIKNFKGYLKISPYQFILEKKMEKAKTMVENSDEPIKNISIALGFASHSNFNKAFLKFYKTTALNCRKIIRIQKGYSS